MNKAKQRVFDCIKSLDQQGVTTSEVAQQLNLSRSVVSHYLNELAKEKQINKIDGRPVKWQIMQEHTPVLSMQSPFSSFIGYRGSMRRVIEQISAATVYPPNGLNILITGNSGVGKSYLAGKIFEYAKKSQVIKEDAPYVVLNCADYANNPELVSSMLFGYVKGAYTGAEDDREGLLAKANGGYLFLDEVHRLSSENQEKLFSFIDSGKFYRMGDNSHPLKSKLRIIMATTETPEDVLLPTFLRRIPVRVNLPNYIDRPIDERMALLRYLFYQEARTINKKIKVDKYVVSTLLQTNQTGNIGYLKNIIQVSCAAAYRNSKSTVLELTLDNLLLDSLPPFEDYGDLIVDPAQSFLPRNRSIVEQKLDQLKKQINKLSQEYSQENLNLCKRDLQKLNKIVPQWSLKSGLHLRHQGLFKQILKKRFGLSQTDYFEPVLYLLYKMHFVLTDKTNAALNEKFNNKLPRSKHVASVFYRELQIKSSALEDSLVIVLAMLLSDHIDEKIQLRGLMVAHGENTATSIQAVVNSLCGTYVFDAIDMPIDTGVNSIITETNNLIDSFNTTPGFVLMVDMGSLSQLYSEIKSHLNGDLLVVNNLTTLTALDLALKMQENLPFNQLAEDADNKYAINVQYYKGFSQSNNILVSCISGLGIAEKVSEIIEQFLPQDLKVIPIDYLSLKEKIKTEDWDYFERTMFVLTTIDLPDQVNFKHMNLYSLLDASGESNLKKWLMPYMSEQQIEEFIQQLIRFFSKEGISERLSFLNPDVVIKQVENINAKYESYYHLNLDGKVKLNLYMHIALMIERLMIQRPNEVAVQIDSQKEADFFKITKSIFQPIEIKYNIKISDYEISLLYELFKQFIN